MKIRSDGKIKMTGTGRAGNDPKKGGQAALEYFIIFAVVAGVVLIVFNPVLTNILEQLQGKQTAQGIVPGFFQTAVGAMK